MKWMYPKNDTNERNPYIDTCIIWIFDGKYDINRLRWNKQWNLKNESCILQNIFIRMFKSKFIYQVYKNEFHCQSRIRWYK